MLKGPITYAFNSAGIKTTVYRKPSTTTVDTFGRPATADYQPVFADITALRNNESIRPSEEPDKTGSTQPLRCNYYFRISEAAVVNGDRFSANGSQWEVFQTISEPHTGLMECFCFSLGVSP